MGGVVRQHGDSYILKSGHRVRPSEAAAMILVLEQKPDLPIPDLIKSEFDGTSERGHLWISIIPGYTLDLVWEKLDDDTKRRLCQNAWDIIAGIRDIRCPPECEGFFLPALC